VNHTSTHTVRRTVTIFFPHDADLRNTVYASQQLLQRLSPICFNEGRPLNARTIQKACYHSVKGTLSAQMTCSAIRRVAAAYQSAASNRRPAEKPFLFRNPSALFLVGVRGRDADFRKDGTLSIWTVGGRKRLTYTVAKGQTMTLASASVDSITVIERKGRLIGRVSVTIGCPEPEGNSPVGIDRNAGNALVAADASDRILFISGKAVRVTNKRDGRRRKRIQKLLAQKKAQKRNRRSIVRSLKRLGKKQRNRTNTFAQTAAKRLVAWAGEGSVLVFEDLGDIPKPEKGKIRGKATRRKLSVWQRSLIREYTQRRAEEAGIPVVFVDPAYTSQDCSVCGCRGTRRRHRFSCKHCGHTDHADVNAAKNIRGRYAVAMRGGGLVPERHGGDMSPGPEASALLGKSEASILRYRGCR